MDNKIKILEGYLQQVIEEARKLNIPISSCISPNMALNTRAKSRFACCRYINGPSGKKFQIEAGHMLFQCDTKDIKGILAHEILHTCEHCNNHGTLWKIYAKEMNDAYGYKIKRTSSYEELGIEKPEVIKQSKYRIVCLNCGMVTERQKKSKVVTNIKKYRCKCGGKLACEEI